MNSGQDADNLLLPEIRFKSQRQAYLPASEGVAKMVLRPRTKFKIARKQKRCGKCNALIPKKGKKVRCKRCSKPVA